MPIKDSMPGSDGIMAPARRLLPVTPDDNVDLAELPRALWIGVGGTISIIAADDSAAVTLTVAGGLLPVRAKRVRASGTTATGIAALY